MTIEGRIDGGFPPSFSAQIARRFGVDPQCHGAQKRIAGEDGQDAYRGYRRHSGDVPAGRDFSPRHAD